MGKNSSSGLLKPGQKYFTRLELARILNVSVRKVDSMIAAKEIPVLHFGKMVRFHLEDVERRLNQAVLTESEDCEPPNTPTARTHAKKASGASASGAMCCGRKGFSPAGASNLPAGRIRPTSCARSCADFISRSRRSSG